MSPKLDPRKPRYQSSGHVCSVHDSRGHQVWVGAGFLKEGVALGQRCLVVGSGTDFKRLAAKLAKSGLDVERERSRGALHLLDEPAPLLESGRLAPERLARFLARSEAAALDSEFSGLRVLVEIDWIVSRTSGDGDPAGLEAVLDWCPPTCRSLVLCQYYRPNLTASHVGLALATHPTIVVDRLPVTNPYYEPQNLFPRDKVTSDPESGTKRLEWRLRRLREAGGAWMSRRPREERRDDLYRRLVETIPHTVWMTRPDGTTDFVNRKGMEYFGFRENAVYGWGWLDLLHPDFVDRSRELWETSVRTGKPYRNEYRLRTADGSYRWVFSQGVPIRSADGTVERWVGTWTDIEDLKRAEAELLLRDRAIQAVTQGILITDPTLPNNPIIYASPGFERLTQYPANEVLGRDCRLLWGQDADPAAISKLVRVAREGRAETVELLAHRKDGTAFWDQISVSPVTGDDGEVAHLVCLHSDVTQRRRLEDQYRQAQKMEAIGLLGGGVAHDFNNLLTVITGYTELLLHSLTSEDPKREMLEEIKRAGERSAALTRQLLAFSRKQMLSPKVLDLNDVVLNTERMLRRVIGEDIRLETNLHPRLASIRGDPGQLEQVLLNLAVNARDAMPRGGSLVLETQNVDLDEEYATIHTSVQPGPYVMLVVTDSGMGMTEDVRRRLFEPFFSTKPPGRGTGLGAAVVHGIIRQSGGHIEVESEPGRGSVFRIYLPTVAQSAAPTAAGQSPPSPIGGSETILLVEDDDGVRGLSLQILRDRGYQVLEAVDGEEAVRIEAGHAAKIDLLITDVVMPGMGGRELSERLLERRPDLKVLFLSGYTDDAVVRHGVFQDKVNFLQKPFAPSALGRKVRQVLAE